MIVIYGAGSIGGALATLLTQQGVNVIVKTRSEAQAQAYREGVRVNQGKLTKLQATSDPSIVKTAEWVILAVQSQQTWKAVAEMKPYISEHTNVLSLQNGIINPHLIQQQLNKPFIIAGSVWWSVTQTSLHEFFMLKGGSLTLGLYSSQPQEPSKKHIYKEKLDQFIQVLNKAIPTSYHDQILLVLYEKLCLNMVNAPFTLTQATYPEGFLDEDLRWISKEAILEALNVVQAYFEKQGWTYSFDRIQTLLQKLSLPLPDLKSWLSKRFGEFHHKHLVSTHNAFRKHRTTNVDFLTGEIVFLGKTLGIPTPINQAILQLMHGLESGKNSFMTPKQLRNAIQQHSSG